MTKSILLKLFAAAGLAWAGPAAAQITQIDPNSADQYEAAPTTPQQPQSNTQDWSTLPPAEEEYYPVDPGSQDPAAPVQSIEQQDGMTAPVEDDASARASAAVSDTVAKDNVLAAAEGVFGRGAEGLAGLLEDILRKQGEPSAYITGEEAGGAVVLGVRYGRGTLHHVVQGDRDVFWTGPSIGFDFGADANKVFVLAYNLHESENIFTRFPGAEGNAYVVGGFTASYMRKGDMVLIPIRMGVGLRMGVNAGYMRFSKKNRWLPF